MNKVDKALNLINFLTDLARLRTKIVRDIANYQNVLWLYKIPHEQKVCFTQAWGASEEYNQNIWIEIKKHDEPILEEVPDICEEWVNTSTLYNTEEIPDLHSSINIQIKESIPETDLNSDSPQDEYILTTKTLKLIDYPEVAKAWEAYVEKKWFPWADLHRRWQSVQNVYAEFFSIHQEQLKLGEEYELVLGLGFLTWRTPSNQTVRRHLVTAKANLTFEARLGKFTVTPAVDGAQLVAELDMLDIGEQPRNARQTANDGLLSANDNPWDRSTIDPLLTALTNSLADQGQGEYYQNNLAPSKRTSLSKPVVDYAPALILRKRSARGLELTLHSMLEQISSGGEIPPLFGELCETQEQPGEGTSKQEQHHQVDETIYFPKPSNEEQRQIIQKLNIHNGVLVQGPPGTGKSHTIANLICHLLATGKRILVTAKTPRALQVLHEKLPSQVRPLCISLLGSGIDEQKSLEGSVSSILSEHDRWHIASADAKIEFLKNSIHRLKTEKAEIEYRVRSIREEEILEHSIIDGRYKGTASKIALSIKKEAAEYNWLQDEINFDFGIPFTSEDLINLRNEIKYFTPEIKAELLMDIPSLENDLPSQETFQSLINQHSEASSRFSKYEVLLNSPRGNLLEKTELSEIHTIIEAVSKLSTAIENIRNRHLSWINEAVHDILTDNITSWEELLKTLSLNISGLKERARKIQNISLTTPNEINYKKLLYDARELKLHFYKGGKIGWGPFKPKVVRDCKYLVKGVQVDGRLCDSLEPIEILIEFILVNQAIDDAWNLWDGKTEKKNGPLSLQVAELEELQGILVSIFDLQNILKNAKESLKCIKSFGEPAWYDSTIIDNILDTCRAVVLKNELEITKNEINEYIKRIENFVKKPDAHPISQKILFILKSNNINEYSKLLSEINSLHSKRDRVISANNTFETLIGIAPIFAKDLSLNYVEERWNARLSNIEGAWAWARAKSWLKDFLNKEDLPSLERRLRQIEDETKNQLAELSATLAWKFCFSRMGESHRQHLKGWQKAISRLGAGTGKHAPKWRLIAQQNLNECRDAVPSWVMPLHRVYETVKPAPGIFDVIIVDEASQCGPEALPLAYLAKRLLVVGDDKQISPEAVGVDRDQVFHLMEEHLKDFEHADSFYVENSLFDHGERRFKNRIVLREHFRCMPEIIRFSNDLCYHATPLIPLRQYPPQRLEPLKLVHVHDGYREGKNNRAINQREAEKLVEAVVQCCNDDSYDGKTMGVIILQGDSQAALIESMLLKELGAEEFEKRRLICGNPYSFQGDERDIIFLSMVAAPNERIGAFTQTTDQRRFNVAASRAKDQMWLFHTATRNDLSESCLRRRLLGFFENPISQLTRTLGEEAETLRDMAYTANRLIEKPPIPFDSWFELDVALQIASRGYRVVPQYPVVENKRIDLVIEGAKSRLAVECDGDYWHGAEQYEKDMERQRMLERCQWKFHRIRECAFYANPDETLEALWLELQRQGIKPLTEKMAEESIPNQDSFYNEKQQEQQEFNDKDEQFNYKQQEESEWDKPLFINQRSNHVEGKAKSKEPTNIQEALAMKQVHLREVIIETLKMRPNYSCVKEALPGFVLKQLQVVSRGKPREEFCRKIDQSLKHLERESIIKIYKATNLRVKLLIPSLNLFN